MTSWTFAPDDISMQRASHSVLTTHLLAAIFFLSSTSTAITADENGLTIGQSYVVIDKACDSYPRSDEICPSVYVYPAKLLQIHPAPPHGVIVYEFVVKGVKLGTVNHVFVRASDIPSGRYPTSNSPE